MYDVFPGVVDPKSTTYSAHAATIETAKKTPRKPEQTNKPPVFRPTAAKGVDKTIPCKADLLAHLGAPPPKTLTEVIC